MNRSFSYLMIYGVLVLGSIVLAQQKIVDEVEKNILVLISSDKVRNVPVSACYVESGITNKILDINSYTNTLYFKKNIIVKAENMKLIASIGEQSYSFDVVTRDGMMCGLFKTADTGLVITTDADASLFTDPIDKHEEITVLLVGEFLGKEVEIRGNSKLIFLGNMDGDLAHRFARFNFKSSKPDLKILLTIEKAEYSLDFDVSEGRFILFEKTETQLFIRQYKHEKDIPELM